MGFKGGRSRFGWFKVQKLFRKAEWVWDTDVSRWVWLPDRIILVAPGMGLTGLGWGEMKEEFIHALIWNSCERLDGQSSCKELSTYGGEQISPELSLGSKTRGMQARDTPLIGWGWGLYGDRMCSVAWGIMTCWRGHRITSWKQKMFWTVGWNIQKQVLNV